MGVIRPVLSDLGNRLNRGSKHLQQRDRDQAKERRVRQIRLQIIANFTLFWSNTVYIRFQALLSRLLSRVEWLFFLPI